MEKGLKELVEMWLSKAKGDYEKAHDMGVNELLHDKTLQKQHLTKMIVCYVSKSLHEYRSGIRAGTVIEEVNLQVKGRSGERYSTLENDIVDKGRNPLQSGKAIKDATVEEVIEDILKYQNNLRGNCRNVAFNFASIRGLELKDVVGKKVSTTMFSCHWAESEKVGEEYANYIINSLAKKYSRQFSATAYLVRPAIQCDAI
jgi:hypothetical protein